MLLLDDDDELIDEEEALIDEDASPPAEPEASPEVDEEAEAAAFFQDAEGTPSSLGDDAPYEGGEDLLGSLFGDLGPPKPPKPKATPGKVPELRRRSKTNFPQPSAVAPVNRRARIRRTIRWRMPVRCSTWVYLPMPMRS